MGKGAGRKTTLRRPVRSQLQQTKKSKESLTERRGLVKGGERGSRTKDQQHGEG